VNLVAIARCAAYGENARDQSRRGEARVRRTARRSGASADRAFRVACARAMTLAAACAVFAFGGRAIAQRLGLAARVAVAVDDGDRARGRAGRRSAALRRLSRSPRPHRCHRAAAPQASWSNTDTEAKRRPPDRVTAA
jgi:hypothetical protein